MTTDNGMTWTSTQQVRIEGCQRNEAPESSRMINEAASLETWKPPISISIFCSMVIPSLEQTSRIPVMHPWFATATSGFKGNDEFTGSVVEDKLIELNDPTKPEFVPSASMDLPAKVEDAGAKDEGDGN